MENTSQLLVKSPPNGSGNINVIVALQVASAGTRLNYCTNEKILKSLLVISSLLGLKPEQMPDQNERFILIDYIRKHLTAYSVEDMELAFTLYIQSKLDFADDHYGKFSVLFLEKVMQSYKRFKVAIPKSTPALPEPPPPSPEEMEQLRIKCAISCFVNYAKNGLLIDYGNVTFDYLDKRKIIPHTRERKWEIFNKAKEQLKQQAFNAAMKGGQKFSDALPKIESNEANQVVSAAKRLALEVFFTELIEAQIELKDLL